MSAHLTRTATGAEKGTAGVSPVDELGVGAAFLPPHPERAADFADMAWVAAQVVGDGLGVCAVQADVSHADGRPWVSVRYTAEARVREVAARFGWEVRGTDKCAYASGMLGSMVLWVEWFAGRRDEPARAD